MVRCLIFISVSMLVAAVDENDVLYFIPCSCLDVILALFVHASKFLSP